MRKKLFIFLALIFVGLFFPLSTLAQEPEPNPDSSEGLNDRFGVEIAQDEIDAYMKATADCSSPSLECLVKNTVTFTVIELTTNIIGDRCALVSEGLSCEEVEQQNMLNTTDPDNADASTQQRKKGVLGELYGYMGLMFGQPVANTRTYMADVMNAAHIATPAYAQGLGFAALDPILDLWKKFRNIAYLCFIFLFIVIGFLIMFRAKIGGQTAVTAQQAIPSVIISLLFVTFSYAIVGLLIDFMYLVMYMMVGLFVSSLPTATQQGIISYNIFQVAGELFSSNADLDSLVRNQNIIQGVLESMGTKGGFWENIGGFVGGLTVTFIIAIAVLISTFKLFFELLKSYASIILNTVLSPMILMMGALPGNNVVKPWIKGMIGNLAAFPTVLLMIILFYEFTDRANPGTSQVTGGFMPPFLLDQGASGIIGVVMGFSIILALPELVKKVKDALGAKDGFGFEIAKAAGDRMKAAATGKTGVPFLPNAGDIGKFGLKTAGGLAGAGVGALASKRLGIRPLSGALGGAFVGSQGLRKGLGTPLKLLNKYGEFMENMNAIGLRDTIEDRLLPWIDKIEPRVADEMNKRRKSPVDLPSYKQQRQTASSVPPAGGGPAAPTGATGTVPGDQIDPTGKI